MNAQTRTFHEDHLKRKAQSLQLAYTRALNSHDGSAPLYLHQEMDFLGHFEPDAQVSLAMVPEVIQQDPVAGIMLMTSQLNTQQTSTLVSAFEKGTVNAALLGQLFGAATCLVRRLILSRKRKLFSGQINHDQILSALQ